MGRLCVVVALVACTACDGQSARDGGPARDVTDVTIFTGVVGGDVTFAGRRVPVNFDGLARFEIEPMLVATSAPLSIEREGAVVELTADWSAGLDEAGVPHDTPLQSLAFWVVLAADGSCDLGPPNGRAGDQPWYGERTRPIEPCGPFVP